MIAVVDFEDLRKGKGYKICRDGTCLFCSAKCSVCGSNEVRVGFRPFYEFEKIGINVIKVIYKGCDLDLYCSLCGVQSGRDQVSGGHASYLEAIENALKGILRLPAECVVKKTPPGRRHASQCQRSSDPGLALKPPDRNLFAAGDPQS